MQPLPLQFTRHGCIYASWRLFGEHTLTYFAVLKGLTMFNSLPFYHPKYKVKRNITFRSHSLHLEVSVFFLTIWCQDFHTRKIKPFKMCTSLLMTRPRTRGRDQHQVAPQGWLKKKVFIEGLQLLCKNIICHWAWQCRCEAQAFFLDIHLYLS